MSHLFFSIWTSAGLIQLQGFIRAPPFEGGDIMIRQANPTTFIEVLNATKHKDFYNIIVDVRKESMLSFFQAVNITQKKRKTSSYQFLFMYLQFSTFIISWAYVWLWTLILLFLFNLDRRILWIWTTTSTTSCSQTLWVYPFHNFRLFRDFYFLKLLEIKIFFLKMR